MVLHSMIETNRFRGTGVATVTPFRDGKIDEPALRKIVEYQINGGVGYLVCLGTTGEANMLSRQEKKLVQEVMQSANNSNLPFVLGIFGGNNTRAQVAELQQWDLQGVDALLIASPAYVKPSQEGIFLHFQALAEASDLPIILYNVPGRTSSNMSAETTLRLAEEFENIIGIKEASGDLIQCSQIIKHRPDGFLVISGDDPTGLGLLACGGDGIISVIANAFPRQWSQLVSLALQGNFSAAAQVHLQLLELHKWLYIEGNPTGVKAILEHQGLCTREVRQPLAALSLGSLANLMQALEPLEIS